MIDMALRQAIDQSTDGWAIFEAIRDSVGKLTDLRILYANAEYWALSGLDPSTATGRGILHLAPGIDWTEGLAARLFQAMESGQTYVDRRVHARPQLGPRAGHERIFDVALTLSGDALGGRVPRCHGR
jgi:PAS domain-containing protein